MSALTPGAAAPATLKPDFLGMVRGELLKIARQRTIGAMAATIGGAMFLFELLLAVTIARIGTGPRSISPPYTITFSGLSDARGFSGIFITIVAVIVIAQEYQQGTIRVLLARGVGRLQLLGAKLLAIMIVGVITYVVSLAITAIAVLLDFSLAGHTDYLSRTYDYFWPDVSVYALTVLASVVVTALIAATLAVIGRSMAFGLGVGLPFFVALDYVLAPILVGISNATQNDLWASIVRFFPGVNLVALPYLIIPNRGFNTEILRTLTDIPSRLVTGSSPAATTTTMAVVVLIAYAAGCLALSAWLVKSRDVLQ
jgi:ABC-2 type transport system permease protein